MGLVIVEQIVSADGMAEDADGGIGFFVNAREINAADDAQLERLRNTAAIVFGVRTYRMFASYWPTADPVAEPVAVPIRRLPKFVVSRTLDAAPWGPDDVAEVLREDGVAAMRGLRQRFSGDLIVWGSLTLSHALLAAGEVDLLRLRVVPVLLGAGRSAVPPEGLHKLSLRTTQVLRGGLTVLEFRSRH